MKKFTLIFVFGAVCLTTHLKGQTLDLPEKHRLGLGPIAGYDFKLKGPSYGAGLMYEYKPFRSVGFTSALSYEQTRKDLTGSDFSSDDEGLLKHHLYSASLGARYYVGSFYLGGALGYAYEYGESQMENGSTIKGGSTNSLYSSLGVGYQAPLRNGDLLEMELGSFGTKNSMKLGGTVKYKFLK